MHYREPPPTYWYNPPPCFLQAFQIIPSSYEDPNIGGNSTIVPNWTRSLHLK